MSTLALPYSLPMLASLVGALLSIIPVLFLEEIVSVAAASVAVAGSVALFFLPDASTGFVYVDGLTRIMDLTVALIYLGAVIYSITYLKHLENPLFQKRFYYFLMNAFAMTMLFSVSASNLGLIWVGIEATTVTSALLVATENDDATIEAAWRYVIIVSSGLVLSLLAIMFLYAAGRSLELSAFLHHRGSGRLFTVGVLLALIGYGTKAGLFPLSTWLPDVHGKAPSPVSAVFSGVLLPVAMYGIMRILQGVLIAEVQLYLLVFGILTVGSAAFLLGRQEDYKRLFAYSTAENMGMIVIGLAAGPVGVIGGVVVLVAHAFGKASVFFLTGNLLARFHSTHIHDVRGVAKRMPRTGYTLLLSSLAVTGAPPFGVFIGELLIVSAVVRRYGIVVALLIAAFLVVAFISVNRKTVTMVLSPGNGEGMERGRVGTMVPILALFMSLATAGLAPVLPRLLTGVLGI